MSSRVAVFQLARAAGHGVVAGDGDGDCGGGFTAGASNIHVCSLCYTAAFFLDYGLTYMGRWRAATGAKRWGP